MKYVHVPVDWKEPTPADFSAFSKILDRVEGTKLLIHCAANYRVTAFFGLYAMKRFGWSAERFDKFVHDVWDPKEYPAWDRFIDDMKEVIAASG
jgi:protein tyrosine phosphatase (PTP) superfamily phosphohydrolase (DUF442 family)